MKRRIGCMLMALFLLATSGSGLADPNLMIQDDAVRAGAWATVYGQILEEHRAAIEDYQEYVSSSGVPSPVRSAHPTGRHSLPLVTLLTYS